MRDNPPPLYARDYLRSAQVAALGYIAPTINIPNGATGELLAARIRNNTQAAGIFTPQELINFSNEYRFIGSTSPGPGSAGGDAVAFQNIATGAIVVGVAGVNDHSVAYKELPQTDIQTALTGANGAMYKDIKSFVFGLMSSYPNSVFDLNGHSAGGQMVQLLKADASLQGIGSRIVTANTFGSFGIGFNHIFDNGFVPGFSDIIDELDRIEEGAGFVHFRNDSDGVPYYSDSNGYRLAEGLDPIYLVDGIDYRNTFGFIEAHGMDIYIRSLRDGINNRFPVVSDPGARPDTIAALSTHLGAPADQVEEIVVTATRDKVIVVNGRRLPPIRKRDPATGALLPRNLRLTDGVTDGSVLDNLDRVTVYEFDTVNGEKVVTSGMI